MIYLVTEPAKNGINLCNKTVKGPYDSQHSFKMSPPLLSPVIQQHFMDKNAFYQCIIQVGPLYKLSIYMVHILFRMH